MKHTASIAALMETSGVKFGTSGARGLVTAMTDEVCFAYTAGFLQYLEQQGRLPPGSRVALAGDLRASTGRILAAASHAVTHRGHVPVHCGRIPSPAVALYGLDQRMPALMVTGSHIPDDRNGIKFNTADGEILKADEEGIRRQTVVVPDDFDNGGMLSPSVGAREPAIDTAAARAFVRRWLDVFPADALAGLRLGVYAHSAVGRDMLVEVYRALGAEVIVLGHSDKFIPVDTEAIRQADVDHAAAWAAELHLDSIVSTDGDSDRPLVSDEHGRWLRGDVAGILCAQFVGADVVVAPISCNTALEACGAFREVIRTRIGSPYVIEAMMRAVHDGGQRVVGYEANGGFLTATDLRVGDRVLPRLPTRDAMLVHLGVLCRAAAERCPVSALVAGLPRRFTASDRLQEFPSERSQARLSELEQGGKSVVESAFGPTFGAVRELNTLDGLRITFETGDVVHLRASGNAPELRCYTEAGSEERTQECNAQAMRLLATWR